MKSEEAVADHRHNGVDDGLVHASSGAGREHGRPLLIGDRSNDQQISSAHSTAPEKDVRADEADRIRRTYFRFWPKADVRQTPINVCLLGKSGHPKTQPPCPLMTNSGSQLAILPAQISNGQPRYLATSSN